MNPDPNYSFQLPRGLLKAMALFQHDDRPSLACASFEIKAIEVGHTLTLAACDGRRLAAYDCGISQDTLWGKMPQHEQFTVDLEGVAKLPKIAGPTGDCVTLEVYDRHVEFVADRLRYTAPRLESEVKYPAWRDIVPKRSIERLTQFAVNHDLLADFGKAAKWICDSAAVALRSYGEGFPIAVLLPSHDSFYGLIMPLKFDQAAPVPEWLREAAADRKEKTAPENTEADKAAA